MYEGASQPASSQDSTPPSGSDRTKKPDADQDFKELQSPHALHLNAETHRLEHPDKETKQAKEGSHLAVSPLHVRSGHHHLGPPLRSDEYLRQALASPYNQRAERGGGRGTSPRDLSPRDAAPALSPSPWREEGGGHVWGSPQLERGRGGHHDGGSSVRPAGVDFCYASVEHLPTFKTPKTAKR